MQVRCIYPFADHSVGDVIEVPDGAEVSPVYFEPLASGGDPPPNDPPPDDPPSDTPPPAAGAFSQPKDN